ncbi:MAG: Gfo/Idh/MocA family oxidoreductase [Clostridia bacterium]|nr:Gfo/Idh/MocA family oxidoreductase [Clostridia bacterium]
MRLASIGTSGICEHFLNAAASVPGIELYAVYSRDPERGEAFRQKYHAKKQYNDLTALASDPEIDAVYIASPNALHVRQSVVLLNFGKHVLCEKPATTTLIQYMKLSELAAKRGIIYAEAIMSIHTPAFSVLNNALKEIGRIRSATIDFCQLSSKYPAYLKGENPNIFNPEFETGCLMDIGVYNLYLAAALFGQPERIQSSAVFLENGADAAGSALLHYKDMTVTLTYSKVAQSFSPSEILGDLGTIRIASVSQLTGIELMTKTETKTLVPFEIPRKDVMAAEAAYFRDCVEKGNHPSRSFAEHTACTVREMCDEIRRQNGFPF